MTARSFRAHPGPTPVARTLAAGVVGLAVIAALGGCSQPDGEAPSAAASTTAAPSPSPAVQHQPLGAALPAEGWPDATYWHVRTTTTIEACGPVVTQSGEAWFARSGPSVFVTDGGAPTAGPAAFSAGTGNVALTWGDLEALPTGSAALAGHLPEPQNDFGGARTVPELELATQLLSGAPTPRGVRIAAWDLLASHPEAVVTQDATDSQGRPGWSVALTRGGQTKTLVVDPALLTVLERSQDLGSCPESASPSTRRTTYLDQGPITELPPELVSFAEAASS